MGSGIKIGVLVVAAAIAACSVAICFDLVRNPLSSLQLPSIPGVSIPSFALPSNGTWTAALGLLILGIFLKGAIVGTVLVKKHCFVTSNPNEWLLLIKGGKMLDAGVGMRRFINPLTTTAVTYPSVVRRVDFSAEQVTLEMQGVQVTGFVVWSVHRHEEGPFKYYKNAGTSLSEANQNIRMVCESILRYQVANMTLKDVMKERTTLRQNATEEIMQKAAGWGVWIETIELTDIKISSKQLFEDLQAEFRQSTHLAAEKLRLETRQQVTEQRLSSELKVAQQTANTQAQQRLHAAETALKREQEEEKLFVKQKQAAQARMQQERELQLEQMLSEHQVELKKQELEMELQQKLKDFEFASMERLMRLEGTMNQQNMQKYALDNTVDIFKQLPIKEVAVHNYVNPESSDAAQQVLPMMQKFHLFNQSSPAHKR